jgi:signal transduction histidine kinase
MALVDTQAQRLVEANPALDSLLESPPGALRGLRLADVDDGAASEVDEILVLALACGDHRPRRRRWTTRRGTRVAVDVQAVRLHGDQGSLVALYVVEAPKEPAARTADPELRAWMARKHEAVGGLASGFARELEGILGRAVSSAEALQAGDASAAGTHARVGEILEAAREARALVRDLLAYTGRQALEVHTLDLNRVLAEAEEDLREGLPQDVGLLVRPSPGALPVHADPKRLREVLAQLVENARDALPEGGYAVVATEAVVLDADFVSRHPGSREGPHALLTVSDTGTGMDEETQRRIFEPFFSTRGRGAGSGMGLATVYGIVKQFGGTIWVTSRPQVGTTFRVYLPRSGG